MRKQQGQRPHPAAKRIARVYKGDTLYSEAQQGYYLVKGFSATDNKLDLSPLIEANGGQKRKAISKIFGEELQCRPVPVSPGGHVAGLPCTNK